MAKKQKRNIEIIESVEDYKELTLDAVNDFNNENYDEALSKFLHLARVNYNNTKIHELLGYLYLKLNQPEKAAEELEIMYELESKRIPNLRKPKTFEEVVADAGDFEEVKAEYENLISGEHENPLEMMDIPSRLCFHYMAMGEYDKAEEVMVRYRDKFFPNLQIA